MTALTAGARQQARKLTVLGLIALAGGTVRGSAQGPPSKSTQGIAVGQEAPDFELKNLTGGRVRLSDLRGHPVLLNFWASWCVPCGTEMPLIRAAYDSLGSGGLIILAVNLTDQERMKDVRAFVDSFKLSFPVLLDDRGHVWERYRLVSLPSTVFIDTAGMVRQVIAGPMASEMLRAGLVRLLTPP
jgi:peroxiredoxin